MRTDRIKFSFDNFLDSANFAGFQANLDAVRVMSGTGQYVFHNAARLPA